MTNDTKSAAERLRSGKPTAPGGLTWPEWCDYWLNGKEYWVGDGIEVGDVLPDLQGAATAIQAVIADELTKEAT